ncbi:sensor histidine kinase [Chitinophaga sp.]|uniref:sensor histidine kinase n=1 Tax=Chitinophaga sp. TaxID=1869181 RepID=UPI002F9329B4
MKNISLLILLLSYLSAFAQPKTNIDINSSDSALYVRFDGHEYVDIRRATAEQLKRIRGRERMNVLSDNGFRGLYAGRYEATFPRNSLAWRLQQPTGSKIYWGNRWQWGTLSKNTILVDGPSSVEVIDGYITPENAKNYRYRIIRNDNTQLTDWTQPADFRQTADGKATYCLLGNIPYQEKQFVQIEIYHVKNYKDRDAILIDWREPRPLIFTAAVGYMSRYRGGTILSVSLGKDRASTDVSFLETDTLTDIRFRLADSLVKIDFHSVNLTTPYNYQIRLKRTIDNKTENIDLGEFNGSFALYKEFWDKAGYYEITFKPKVVTWEGSVSYLTAKARSYQFMVLPPLTTGKWFSNKALLLIGLVGCAFFGISIGSLWIWLRKKNQKKVREEQQQKDVARTQLATVRSQLNPHFMFNALAGIQHLMNKQQTEEANHYLGKFARLTRNVLDNKELISLHEEKNLLEDYLQMEQLRFGFNYEIVVGQGVDIHNIEIPAMLLQPFVENAVKHGISTKKAAGNITISFVQQGHDLMIKIADNGQGFDVTKNYTGLGLQLSKNRISLLNTIYQDTPFVLLMDANDKGTTITITLIQWL